MEAMASFSGGGRADILKRTLDGEKTSPDTGCKKLKPLARRTAIPAERKGRNPPPAHCLAAFEAGVSCAKSDEKIPVIHFAFFNSACLSRVQSQRDN
ncbi:MAG: hypothetical protein LBU32_02500 [Clostridiales bacterium]|nr:hypothetical protein [Clostridiales bacterium]